jgi:hypothetical protein
VSKKIADRLHADTAVEQSHGKGVAQRIRGCALKREAALPRANGEDVNDRVVRQGSDRATGAQEQLRLVATRPPGTPVTP